VAKKAIQGILPFGSTYLYKSWVLNSLANENKTKKQIGCGKYMPCALSNTFPRIHELSKKKQSPVSH